MNDADKHGKQSHEETGDIHQADSAAEQRWLLLFEQSPLSIQIFSPDGQTIRFNRAWSNLFGLSDDEAYSFNVLKDPTLEQSGALTFIRRAFAGEVVFVPPVQFPVRNNPSVLRWIGGTLYPVITPDGVLREVVVIHHDITELKQAEETLRDLNVILEARVTERTTALRASEEELRKALAAEQELNLLKTSFVGMVSHEFRTPLGIIQAAADLLQRHHDKLDAGQRERQTESIQKAVKRMAGMMEDILLLARMDGKTDAENPVQMDVSEWLHGNIDALCPDQDARARLAIHAAVPVVAMLDDSLLFHVMANLISNACKYSPADDPVAIYVTAQGDTVHLIVQDQGIGIAEEEQARLFDGFFRASNVGTRPGSGLGLTIAARCVQRMGGRLDVSSQIGSGSAFHVSLPRHRGALC